MTTNEIMQTVHDPITMKYLALPVDPTTEELSDLELEAIAGGKERVFSYPVSASVVATGTPDGKVSEVRTRIDAHVKTVDLPTVGNVASRAAALPTYSVGIAYGTHDSHQKPQNTLGY